MTTVYDFKERTQGGQELDLQQFTGDVMVIVNTASKCGLAPQLTELQALYDQYQDEGFTIIGCPSNQFKQELDDASEIGAFCQKNYGVTFPMTEMMAVNGDETAPLFDYLKTESGHGRIKWNYTKFLVGRDGQLIARYAPTTAPSKMVKDIERALAATK